MGNNASKEQLKKLQKLQTKCLELIQDKKSNTNLNKTLGILSIEDMVKLENMKFGYKLVHWMLPQKITEICCKDSKQESLAKIHQYSTRNKRVPNLPRKMTKLYRESFLCKGPQSWLTLSVETKSNCNLKAFTNNCKRALLSNQHLT